VGNTSTSCARLLARWTPEADAIGAASALDFAANVPDLLDLAPRIRCPVLYIRGDREPADLYPAEAFAARCAGPCEVAVLADCDHFYNGCEQSVRERVADWLERTLGR
jgi:pimeloyl-ACP methyl ester carboxylesterase